VESLGHKKYLVDFTDDASRWSDISFIARENQVLNRYKALEKSIKTQHGVKIKILWTDCGMEFKNDQFDEHLRSHGTKQELTVHDTHEQVRVAERLNWTRAMLFNSGLLTFLWAEAMHHAIWIKN
jgi:hypothetical protein